MQEHEIRRTDSMTRLAICAAAAVAVIYAGERLCEGKHWPLWDKYGPWILEIRIQAIAILAAVLYGASLALWPEDRPVMGKEPEGFEACP